MILQIHESSDSMQTFFPVPDLASFLLNKSKDNFLSVFLSLKIAAGVPLGLAGCYRASE